MAEDEYNFIFFYFFFAPKREKYFERIIFIAFPFIEE